MLTELDEAAGRLNISRRAVIKTIVREGLDRNYMAASARNRVGVRDADSQMLVRWYEALELVGPANAISRPSSLTKAS